MRVVVVVIVIVIVVIVVIVVIQGESKVNSSLRPKTWSLTKEQLFLSGMQVEHYVGHKRNSIFCSLQDFLL